MIFDKNWFLKYQRLLLRFANSFVGRYILCLKSSDVGNNKIIQILPNSITWNEGKHFKTEFRTHDKFSKRLFHAFKLIWYLFHRWDQAWYPKFNLGFDTLTTYPASGANSPVDGTVERSSVDESFATIRAGAGTAASDTGDDSGDYPALVSSTTSNQFQSMRRGIYLFDTSTLTSLAEISNATISVYGNASNTKNNQMGSEDWHWCASTPAANNTLATSDYGNLGTTSFGSITYASFTGGQYNDTTLNASGLAAISKTSISKFGSRLSNDINGSFTGIWGSSLTDAFRPVFADHTGTSQDPKLVVTYIMPGGFIYMST